MMLDVTIDGVGTVKAVIDKENSATVDALEEALPIESKVNRWGDEIYFYVDFDAPVEEDARSEMNVGEIAYWPNGPAIAIFFGPTPASNGAEPVAASDCNVIGRIEASPDLLRMARNGTKIRIEKSD